MLFNSLAFAVFLPVVLAGYYVLNRRGQNLWLLAASLVFYGWWDPRFLLLLAVPTVIDYVCALRIAGTDAPATRRGYLLFSVATNLAILGFFKYFNFFVDSAVAALGAAGIEASRPLLEVVLPVGISFYTFHELSYVIDVYRGHLVPVRDFSVYVLYVLYFPQLVAGPIARASNLLPQLVRRREVTWEHVREGLLLMLVGFFKKIGIADAVAPLVDARFLDPSACSGGDLLLALYLFSIQIYCDFSGYTDIARGVSKLFGIELLLNFDHPYFAENITEFWRRWHISLSTWLRDYLYVPLGGNRGGTLKTYRNLMLTMLLGGLWHGANWTFVVWGGLHGLYLSVNKYFLERRDARRDSKPPASPIVRLLKILATFHLVALAWVFFRAGSFATAWAYLTGIATWQPSGAIQPLDWLDPRLVVLFVTFMALEIVQARDGGETSLLRYHWAARGVCYAWLVVVTLALGGIGVQIPFIYFQF
jgi:alginate O-acetyltransferase complex protein AlgI